MTTYLGRKMTDKMADKKTDKANRCRTVYFCHKLKFLDHEINAKTFFDLIEIG